MQALQRLANDVLIELVVTTTVARNLFQQSCRGQSCDHIVLFCGRLAEVRNKDCISFFLLSCAGRSWVCR
eukprot:11226201-Prorocentrum_lima.AAC.1